MSDKPNPAKDRWSRRIFLSSLAMLIFTYGVMVGGLHWFPYGLFDMAMRGASDLQFLIAAKQSPDAMAEKGILPWYFKYAGDRKHAVAGNTPDHNLTLLTMLEKDLKQTAILVDGDGHEVHRWDLDWFRLWPDAEHVPEDAKPKSRPGTNAHGAVLLKDRKLVFNYEHLGMMCVDRDGNPLWKLPYVTHHSVHLASSGNLWVSGQRRRDTVDPLQPSRVLPFDEYMVLEVSPDGKLLNEWSIDKILIENGYGGLLRMPSLEYNPQIADDVLHLNDVEPFPENFVEGVFKHGDVMVSLRNINTVFVFNTDSGIIRYIKTGATDGQHDPDFIDGNRYSVFNNNRTLNTKDHPSSSILIFDARDNSSETYYEGTLESPFYTWIAGKHQWLPNGHLLLTEACEGRAIELDRERNIVWEYRHYVGKGIVGLVLQADRLGPDERTTPPNPLATPYSP